MMHVGILGSGGRLGIALTAACGRAGVPVVAELDRSGLTQSAVPDVVFDASSADLFECTVELVSRWQASLVYCVSVVPAEHRTELARLAQRVPVLLATNLSPGHWMQLRLTEQLAGMVRQCDLAAAAAVYERHPVTKRDRPSASARQLAQAWQDHASVAVGEIMGVRHGPPVSGHQVRLDLAGESLGITHEVSDLAAAASGALLLAARVRELPPGLVTSDEVYDELFGGGAR